MSTFPRRRRDGFTLVEVLVVVVILGILAAMVVPMFRSLRGEASMVAFKGDVKVFADAATIYYHTTGEYLEDSGSGTLPAGFADYIDENKWLQPTPIGGVWDMELDSFGIKSGFGVHFMNGDAKDDAFMGQIDNPGFDNGDLATGAFRKIDSDRYYYILAEN
ncbi:MAG: prepilin-type N-terminal cleavage/methylation domain-containing protein [Planctomycetota bacterium]